MSHPTLLSIFAQPALANLSDGTRVVGVTVNAGSVQEATRKAFGTLFECIRENNIPMGSPVITKIPLQPDGTFTVYFTIGTHEVVTKRDGVESTTLQLGGMRRIDFGGWVTQAQIGNLMKQEGLKPAGGAVYVAQYNSPFRAFGRRNQLLYFTTAD